jgi:SAM-dependent methyltransferase
LPIEVLLETAPRLVLTLGAARWDAPADLLLPLDPLQGLDQSAAGYLRADFVLVGRDAEEGRQRDEAAALAAALHPRGELRLQAPAPRLAAALAGLGFQETKPAVWQAPRPPHSREYGPDYLARWGEVDFMANWRIAGSQILRHLPWGLKPDKAVILDVGSLNGYIMESLRRSGAAKVLGCDISADLAIDAAVDPWHWAATRVFDFCENDYPDGFADMVICMEVLEHVPAAAAGRFLAQLKRVLKPGGVLLASISDDWAVDETHINCRARHSWYAAFAAAGLIPWGRQVIFPGFNNFVLRSAGKRASGPLAKLLGAYAAWRGDAVAARRPPGR